MYLTMCPHAELHLSSCIKPYVDDEGEVHEGRAKKKDQTTPPKKKKTVHVQCGHDAQYYQSYFCTTNYYHYHHHHHYLFCCTTMRAYAEANLKATAVSRMVSESVTFAVMSEKSWK